MTNSSGLNHLHNIVLEVSKFLACVDDRELEVLKNVLRDAVSQWSFYALSVNRPDFAQRFKDLRDEIDAIYPVRKDNEPC